jgi:hypothetical protein
VRDLIVRFLEHWNLRIGQLSRALTTDGRRGSTANSFPGPEIFLDERIDSFFTNFASNGKKTICSRAPKYN